MLNIVVRIGLYVFTNVSHIVSTTLLLILVLYLWRWYNTRTNSKEKGTEVELT